MNISAFTTGLMICTSLLMSGCTVKGIANSNISVEGNDAKPTVNKTVKIGDFNEIEASQGIKVIFVQDANTGIAEVSTTPSAEKYLNVEVKDKTLKAYYSNSGLRGNMKIKGPSIIRVSSPVLNEVDLSSAANVSIEGQLNVKGNFEIELSSASSFEADMLSCKELDAELSSSASANIGDLRGNLDVEVSSASSISVGNLKGNVDAEASSAASIKIGSIKSSSIKAEASSASSIYIDGIAGGNVDASASSGAKIKLSGKADNIKQNSSSGGSVDYKSLSVAR
ncbi:MAG: DUF2807 domain-containing protein [Muribaculaceae bacterium]|nr:DUF2807 domain-containing protein [Muribaculaceae bacterium]